MPFSTSASIFFFFLHIVSCYDCRGFSKLTVILEQEIHLSYFKTPLQLSLVQVDLVLGELCGINENRNINPAVDHCCKTNFAFRRSCFESLEADKTYVPPSTSQGLFTFHADLCQAHNEELQRKKDRYQLSLLFIIFFRLKTHHVFMRRFLVMDVWSWCYNPVPSVKLSSLSRHKT